MWWIREYWLIVRLQILDLIFRQPTNNWKNGNKGEVLLIQGVNERWHAFNFIGSQLNTAGYKIHTVPELGYNLKPLIEGVEIVKKYIRENKLKNITLVCHSKGCLEGQMLLKDEEYFKLIKKVILICSPNQGSVMAKFNPYTKDLMPNSDTIKNLKLNAAQLKKITNIYPTFDNHVIPVSSLILTGANNIQLPIKGHTLILNDERILELVSKSI